MNPIERLFTSLAHALARVGLLDAERGDRVVDLAWPRMVTGFARISQRVADFAMVGTVLGADALAGMAFGLAYWQVGNTVSIGLSGGTISQVSQRYGADDAGGVGRAIAAGGLVALAMAAPLAAVFALVPRPLVALLSDDPAAIGYGAAYLGVVGPAVLLEFLNKVASRALLGADDAWTPMVVRATGAVVNVACNAVFIFAFGLGVVGAALGTALATALVAAAFVAGFLRGSLPGVGAFPATVDVSPPHAGAATIRELLELATPLIVRRLAQTLAVFPLLAIAATFGSGVVAALEVARRVRSLVNAPNWGFSMASSSLAGQQLGAGDEREADAYGWDVLRFSLVVHLLTALAVFALARPLARLFVDEPGLVDLTATFVRVAAVSVLGWSVDGAATGVLRAAGDTRWPMYGKILGLYLVALPVAALGPITSLGVAALYGSLLCETFVPAAVSLYRFSTGAWLDVNRRRTAAADDD